MKDLITQARAVEARLRKPIHQASELAADTIAALCKELEAAQETLQHLNHALRDATESPTFMGEPVSLLRQPVKSLLDIRECYCPPDKCQAPVIMGRQTPCIRKFNEVKAAIAAQGEKA